MRFDMTDEACMDPAKLRDEWVWSRAASRSQIKRVRCHSLTRQYGQSFWISLPLDIHSLVVLVKGEEFIRCKSLYTNPEAL